MEQWCCKCQKFYETCQEAAAANGLRVVEGLHSSNIVIRCERRAHKFTITYSKKLNSLSCADCRREEREEWKEQLRQEELIRTQQQTLHQQELFEKARMEMGYAQYYYPGSAYPQGYYHQANWQHQSSSWSSSSSSQSHFVGGDAHYYQRIEEQANQQAQKLTLEYLRQAKLQRQSPKSSDKPSDDQPEQPQMEENSEKVFIVFKFIHTPIEAIIAGMMQMQRDQAMQYFRKLALLLHPDKNQHLQAKEAF